MPPESPPKRRPFLVLPLPPAMPKKLRLFAKTWPPKREDKQERPLTATLDKPTILNISLMGIIDMSTVRKEFLDISNLCRLTAVIAPRTASKDANNNQSRACRIPRKGKVAKLEGKGEARGSKLPEPCRTCGRPDQPERFHSHPEKVAKVAKKEEVPKMKSTVQKPMAMKYKSKLGDKKALPISEQRKNSLPAQKIVHTPPSTTNQSSTGSGTPRVGSARRFLTCYICGREFGTASLHLHEPKCLQKWERENATLPQHLRRKPPVKPSSARSAEEYNQVAWESSQSQLAPCPSCGRTFNPDRLLVHRRICKGGSDSSKSSGEKPAMGPPNVECYICGKLFGHHSIKIHERQCLKKWRAENEALPPDIRAPEPVRKEAKPQKPQETVPSPRSSSERPSSARKAPMFPCYICGRLFTVNSIYIHEPQCLKMWKVENDKLPSGKRRPQPLKPDVKFTPTGDVDFMGTFHRIWDNHLAELVECRKCNRKFFPDRIETHERACAGLRVQLKKQNSLKK